MRPACIPAVLILGAVLLSPSGFAQKAPAFPTLRQGTPVTLQLKQTVDSASARRGDRLAFQVTRDVMLQDRVAIPAGASALGTVSQVLHRGRRSNLTRRPDRVDLQIDAVRLPSGQIISLAASPDLEDNGRGTAADSIESSLEPSPVNSGLLGMHRNGGRILEGTLLRAYVRRDTLVLQQRAFVGN